ncbi:rRNA pseudouridine synthase [Crassaminicella thermophila]|uniref:Pseudouridine synthase n=1 Tax=Crassaminicella thermophila TaxID=2599308 RepID=A0A5C0SE47_CRATE|nr:pseudouridine synthase [Crassaminicella thermophila]QEK12192.1 rRNA pseudouridine synthase [Crassaminicella thermophila]
MRLQKYIAHSGVASRRKAEELIKLGRVKVNGKVIIDMGVVVDPTSDVISVDNKVIQLERNKVYIMLNKPEGYITTLSDEFNRPTVADLVKDINERIYPVGRLDYDTSGLLIMTNDGDLSYQLTHPKHEVKKTYIAKIKGIPNNKELHMFKTGIDIGGYITAPAQIEVLKKEREACLVKVIIHEGKNRQIRKMFDKINHPVTKLKRIAIGKITMDNLQKGKWRYLTDSEIKYLKSC